MPLDGDQSAVVHLEHGQPSPCWGGWVFRHLSFSPKPVRMYLPQQPGFFVGRQVNLSSGFLRVHLAEAQPHLNIF